MLDMMAPSVTVIKPLCQLISNRSKFASSAVIIPHMNSDIVQRIEQRLNQLELSAQGASVAAGLSKDAIRNWQRHPENMPSARSLIALAPVLKTSVKWLIGESDDPAMDSDKPFGVRFGGIVEAGAFRPNDGLHQDNDYRLVNLPPDPRYPAAAQYAFSVVGDSMTEAHIFEGMHVLAVDAHVWERLHGEPGDGKLVVVARTRNGDPERELTVKRLRIFRDRIELQPMSRNPHWQPLVFPNPPVEDGPAEATIIAVVLQATWIYE